ncbi:MAG: hypothetical protein MUC89_07990 [Acetobacteraceae bacterium]|jgi:hypothetical protein|nr:hypothetical protein [Acetobacteraceae bacterium]
MDDTEQLVFRYLQSLGFADIRYEPDGASTPDFLLDGRIAVEATRLDQHYGSDPNGPFTGLDVLAMPLARRMTRLLASLGAPDAFERSWYVFYSFRRPVPEWRCTQREVLPTLRAFMSEPCPEPRSFTLASGIRVDLMRGSMRFPTFFVLGGYMDEDAGGFVVSELMENLAICVRRKSAKIACVRPKYREWWLVMPDRIGYALDETDRARLPPIAACENGAFDKVILIDPREPARAFQVWPRRASDGA